MPQPPLDIHKYFTAKLPHIHEKYPPGTGGTGPRSEWPEGTLKGVEVVDDFDSKVKQYFEQLPKELIYPEPYHKYPKTVQVANDLPDDFRTSQDLSKALTTLPLAAIASVLTALEGGPQGYLSNRRVDAAGYESDGGEEDLSKQPRDDSKAWAWRYSKSPQGSPELLLVKGESNDVNMVVRTINSSAFTEADWAEFAVTGPYQYTTKNKASWYWSRTWGACKRLDTRFWVLTDWQRWVFGCFDKDESHGWVSPIMPYDASDPTILATLFYWAQSSKGEKGAFARDPKDVSGLPALFPANPARRVSISGHKPKVRDINAPKKANESDIEESDAE